MSKHGIILLALSFAYVIAENGGVRAQPDSFLEALENHTQKKANKQVNFSDNTFLHKFIENESHEKVNNVEIDMSDKFTDLVYKRFPDGTFILIKLGHVEGKNADNGYARIIYPSNSYSPNWYKNRLSYKVAENTEKAKGLESGNYTLNFGKDSDKILSFNLKQFTCRDTRHTMNDEAGSSTKMKVSNPGESDKTFLKQVMKRKGQIKSTATGNLLANYYDAMPAPDIKGARTVYEDDTARYFTYNEAKNYIWKVKNGKVLENNGNTIHVKWSSTGIKKVKVKFISEFGESEFADFDVKVMSDEKPRDNIKLVPNDEAHNDRLKIQELDTCSSCYPNSELYIFYLNGAIAYHEENYQNNWKGEGLHNQSLPSGVYYYNLDLKGDGSKLMRGYIRLKK